MARCPQEARKSSRETLDPDGRVRFEIDLQSYTALACDDTLGVKIPPIFIAERVTVMIQFVDAPHGFVSANVVPHDPILEVHLLVASIEHTRYGYSYDDHLATTNITDVLVSLGTHPPVDEMPLSLSLCCYQTPPVQACPRPTDCKWACP